MKIVKWILGVSASIIVLFAIAKTVASERVEVVQLYTVDEHGETVITRIWVVDHDGCQYLRVGVGGSGWFTRLLVNESIKLTRGDITKTYTTQNRPDKSKLINELMQEKYTWGDTFFATLFGGREGSIPIELHEVTD
ncbi:MAG: hypothetical protein JKY88_19655 [Pseudomonadales bacterium]|nr:hypothetical protein [Pseudomonadales bacterium]